MHNVDMKILLSILNDVAANFKAVKGNGVFSKLRDKSVYFVSISCSKILAFCYRGVIIMDQLYKPSLKILFIYDI